MKEGIRFPLDAIKVLEGRYLLKNDARKVIETPIQLFRRVAKAIAKEIKSIDRYKDIPIIVLSGLTDQASKYIATKDDAVEFLEKPVDIEKLNYHIQDLLGH